ncbi:MAG: dTDP-4-dehydrorhamnose 3,5-epimerase, partial [Candidatus Shapirobacteria bacterium]|nr:dTDP-4-dehydrorhamnose 3,5-epimerase [Candidatus Shapirobacteria bacterium]
AVDIRKNSPTFGQYETVILTEENKTQLFIPKGFAHGFLVLSDVAEFQYKCSNFYNKESEGGLLYNDPELNIKWPQIENLILSEKDKLLPTLSEIKNLNIF